MLFGTTDVERLAQRAPHVALDGARSVRIGAVQWLQFTHEIPGDRQSLLPPNFAPTSPAILTLQFWRAAGGELGQFGLAQARVSCRAGVRIRAFLLQSVIEGVEAARILQSTFGYFSTPGTISIQERSDIVSASVTAEGRCVVDGQLSGLRYLEPSALQHIENMHLVNTADGLRLIQLEPAITTNSLLRGPGLMRTFDCDFWGLPGRMLGKSVIGASAHTDIVLNPIRYVQEIRTSRSPHGSAEVLVHS